MADPRSGPLSVNPLGCHDPAVRVKTPTCPPPRQPVATRGAPVGRMATASSAVTPQPGDTRLRPAAETSGDQEERLVGAASARAPPPITAMAPPGVAA